MTLASRAALGDELALLNAVLNGTCAAMLIAGRVAIARRLVKVHRGSMLGAVLVSCLFLTSYLTRVALTGTHADPHRGVVHGVYLAVLVSHMLLAMAVVPLVLVTLWRGQRGRYAAHRTIARVTYPIWLYVSVTGFVVYVMLYHLPV